MLPMLTERGAECQKGWLVTGGEEQSARSEKCKVRSAKCKVQSEKCKVQSDQCKVRSAE
jgi:hypothetical protein